MLDQGLPEEVYALGSLCPLEVGDKFKPMIASQVMSTGQCKLVLGS
jgi:hypothetical protein